MTSDKVSKKKKVQPAPYRPKSEPAPKPKVEKKKHALIEERKRHFGIGQSIRPKRDLTRFVKWPKYVRIQRQEKILRQRLTAPPSLNQFNVTAEDKLSSFLYRLMKQYKPEDRKQKRLRLRKIAEAKLEAEKSGKEFQLSKEKPYVIKYGLNHVTSLIEKKQARLVLIARDVEPIEMVVWMPALCRKMGVPYCIVKSKAKLGTFVNKKTATCICFTRVRAAHQTRFNAILKSIESGFTQRVDLARRKWSTPLMGLKTRKLMEAKDKHSVPVKAAT